MARDVRAATTTFEGEPAVELVSGDVTAAFLPGLGLTGASLRHRGRERLALRDGLDGLRSGRTAGLPLLAPWANRLSAWRYAVAGVTVDLAPSADADADADPAGEAGEAGGAGRSAGMAVRADGATGLPIHGLLVGAAGWTVDDVTADADAAVLRASRVIDVPAFPFPHRLSVEVAATGDRLAVATSVTPTGDRPVPVAFGWHPYLTLPEAPRSDWRLVLPRRTHLLLDEHGIPTGEREPAPADDAPLGGRTFDDLFELVDAADPGPGPETGARPGAGPADDRRFAFVLADGTSVALLVGDGYPCAQVWVPKDTQYAALEPMAAPTDALAAGTVPLVDPGATRTARFALAFT
jgi:galactose mutarotase-like enzyme